MHPLAILESSIMVRLESSYGLRPRPVVDLSWLDRVLVRGTFLEQGCCIDLRRAQSLFYNVTFLNCSWEETMHSFLHVAVIEILRLVKCRLSDRQA